MLCVRHGCRCAGYSEFPGFVFIGAHFAESNAGIESNPPNLRFAIISVDSAKDCIEIRNRAQREHTFIRLMSADSTAWYFVCVCVLCCDRVFWLTSAQFDWRQFISIPISPIHSIIFGKFIGSTIWLVGLVGPIQWILFRSVDSFIACGWRNSIITIRRTHDTHTHTLRILF